MALIGYARVSSAGQSLEIQVDRLASAGCEKIFEEKQSAAAELGYRFELENALDWVREGDILMVTRLDRLARSILDLHQILGALARKGVGFRCLDQAMDTTTAEGRLMVSILGAFAEFERDLIRERQAEGIRRAKAKGVYGKPRRRKVTLAEIETLQAEGITSPTALARKLGCHRSQIYRALTKDGLLP